MKRTVLFGLLAVFVVSFVIASPAHAQDSSTSLYKIYSNLRPTPDCYDMEEGWDVGLGQSMGMPFTPKADARVNEAVLGLLFYEGEDVATVSINEDDDGLPGKAIHTWALKNLGKQLWHGCYTSIAKSKQGIALTKGNQYWVVGEAPSGTGDIWAWTVNETKGDFAYDEGEGWKSETDDYLSAFAVFGTKAEQ
jgi:hypothetical protein